METENTTHVTFSVDEVKAIIRKEVSAPPKSDVRFHIEMETRPNDGLSEYSPVPVLKDVHVNYKKV